MDRRTHGPASRVRVLWGEAMSVQAILNLYSLGDPELGVWCERCLLPSAATASFATQVGDAPPGHVVTVTVCPVCGWQP